MMKKFMLIALTAFAACHAQDPVSTQAQPSGNSIQINCQNFELDREAQLICAYWKDSGKLAAPINLDYFTQIYEVNYIRDLSPPDYAFYANTEAKYLGDTYKVYVYPNSGLYLNILPERRIRPLQIKYKMNLMTSSVKMSAAKQHFYGNFRMKVLQESTQK